MRQDDVAEKWARLRFAVIGKLLVEPPEHGQLQRALEALTGETWKEPGTGKQRRFSFPTVERWYYAALGSDEPIKALRRRVRSDAGTPRIMVGQILAELEAQYRAHPKWSRQLHADNLKALVEEKPALGSAPSYSTVRRTMNKHGWRKRPRKPNTPGGKRAEQRLERREVRSYEVSQAHALWHFDFHEGSRHVLVGDQWHKPVCLCILDDFSRLGCHAQWYLEEETEALAHGLIQAMMKRGLPRGALSDNGGAMTAEETQNGFSELSIIHDTTLPYSPYQNGKQESFWGQLEGRLMAMLEAVDPLTLTFLNQATQAWLELEYNRSRHSEIGMTPLQRMLEGSDVSRSCPTIDTLKLHFTIKQKRTQRRSDGTISIGGVRFEIPSKYRDMDRVRVRYARWEPSRVYLIDPHDSAKVLAQIYPQNKQKNADRRRRALHPVAPMTPAEPAEPVPPLLRKLLADYAATGLPPAYIPHDSELNSKDNNDG